LDDEMYIFCVRCVPIFGAWYEGLLQVEEQLFKIHGHFLKGSSEVLRWMFFCPPPADGPEGGSDDRAIPLDGVTAREFVALLDYFYEG
jgi:hypothetical protein